MIPETPVVNPVSVKTVAVLPTLQTETAAGIVPAVGVPVHGLDRVVNVPVAVYPSVPVPPAEVGI